MSVLYLALPIALLLALGFLAAFLWANHHGQFDDLEGAAGRAIYDDERPSRNDERE